MVFRKICQSIKESHQDIINKKNQDKSSNLGNNIITLKPTIPSEFSNFYKNLKNENNFSNLYIISKY